MIWQFLRLIFVLLKELFFDSEDEYNIRSKGFRPKKLMVFILVLLSFAGNVIFLGKIYYLSVLYIEMRNRLEVAEKCLTDNEIPKPEKITQVESSDSK